MTRSLFSAVAIGALWTCLSAVADPPATGTPVPRSQHPPGESGTADGKPAPIRSRPSGPTDLDLAVLAEVNRLRSLRGLPPMRFDARLFVAARAHSEDQLAHNFLGHGSSDPEQARLSQRLALTGYVGRMYAEVVAQNYFDAASVVAAWMESPSHRDVLLDPHLTEGAFSSVGSSADPRVNRWTGDFGAPVALRRPALKSKPEIDATGTGFFVSTNGYFVTCHHVIVDASKIEVRTPAGLVRAKVVKSDRANDLALLKVEGNYSALPVATSAGIKLGTIVATVGFPNPELQGVLPKLTKGDISSLGGPADDPRFFQVSLPAQPGNSGGALFDERGRVVGVVSGKLRAALAIATSGEPPENVNYAVKSTYLLALLEGVADLDGCLPPEPVGDRAFTETVKAAEAASVLVFAR